MEHPREKEAASRILDSAFIVHRTLGPGLLETVYEQTLAALFDRWSISYQRQQPIRVTLLDQVVDLGY